MGELTLEELVKILEVARKDLQSVEDMELARQTSVLEIVVSRTQFVFLRCTKTYTPPLDCHNFVPALAVRLKSHRQQHGLLTGGETIEEKRVCRTA